MSERQTLGLQWPHKKNRLLYEYDDGKPQPRFTDLCFPEPRVLVDLEQHGSECGEEWTDDSNLLIRGDNLIALETLSRYYAGKVKLIYIDPPFNTGMAFNEYDDGLEHSTWLTMMRDRLEILRELLTPDGSLWCEIDDTEFGYLNVLMDEVFGRQNRIATVTVKRSAPSMQKAINPGPINVTDFILGYGRERNLWRYRPQLVLREKYDANYNKWIANVAKAVDSWSLEPLPEVFAQSKGFDTAKEGRKELGGPSFKQAMETFAVANNEHVVRLARPNYEGVSKAARELIDRSSEDEAIHHLPRDDFPDLFYFKGQQILFLSTKVTPGEDREAPSLAERLTNFWDDIPWQGIANEGGVKFAKNKKPERLLRRIIAMASGPGDLVLDSFAGSGTTGAVAHKMGRKWIMVEMGDHAETLALKRLKAVVAGKDPTGISKIEAFSGGGGFRFMSLGEPLLMQEPELGLQIINPAYANGRLVTAVLLREGFHPTGHRVLHGKASDWQLAHVTEEFVTTDYVQAIESELQEGATLIVFCLRHDSDLEPSEAVTVRRIPHELANTYCDSAAVLAEEP